MKDKKLFFLLSINILPIFLMFFTSLSYRIKNKNNVDDTFLFIFWEYYLFIFSISNKFKKINSFLYGFFFVFFIASFYIYISISQTDKRTDYPGKEMA